MKRHEEKPEEQSMPVTDPYPAPPIERTSPAQRPDAGKPSATPASFRRLMGLSALIVVLVIAAFVGADLAWTHLPVGGSLAGNIPSTPSSPPSVYLVAGDTGDTLYALDFANGTLRWHTSTDGALTPDPIVVQGVIYTTGIPNGAVAARRASDGAVLWRTLVVQAEGKRLALAGDTLYLTTDMLGGEVLAPNYVHGIYALRASDGAIRWQHTTNDPVLSPPLVVDGVVYAGIGTSLVALRASDGVLLWQRPLAVNGHPYLALWLASAAGTVYTYGREQHPEQPYGPNNGWNEDATVFAVQASTGAVRWSQRLDGSEPDQEVSTPVIADGLVYVRSNGFGSRALARGVPSVGGGLHALRASDGAPVWTYPAAVTQPVAVGGDISAGDVAGNVITLHSTDGTLSWKKPLAGPVSAGWRLSLASADGALVVGAAGAAGGEVSVQALDASDGQPRWQCRLPGSAFSLGMPVFAA